MLDIFIFTKVMIWIRDSLLGSVNEAFLFDYFPVLWICNVLIPIWIWIRTYHFDADPDPDSTLSFTHVGKSKDKFGLFTGVPL
jgi:hypothetical protein